MKEQFNVDLNKLSNYLGTAVTVGAVFNGCIPLVEHGFDKSPVQFLVPSFILFFGAPLYANLVYKQVVVDHNVLGSYFLGVALFLLAEI